MSDAGKRMQQRRERLGLSVVALAKLAKVNRGTVSAIESGQNVRRDSWTKVERALVEAESDAGFYVPPREQDSNEQAEIEMEGPDGRRVVARFKGSPAGVAEAVARVLRQIETEDKTDHDEA